KKAIERETLRRDNKELRLTIASLQGQFHFGEMIGKSQQMQAVFRLAAKVAPYNTTVLITGESGTGKELVAKGIHKASDRSGNKIVAVNCGAFPEGLIESELFGYVKGAFTGADQSKKGVFQEADEGTLFLDEIGELPLSLQVKLLRVLQEGEVKAVGATGTLKVNVRILAATAKNLDEEVRQGRFRQDLLYRLNVLNVNLPPLRERDGDIPLLIQFFIERYSTRFGCSVLGVAPSAMTILMKYDWPGNVRQLENIIERGVILAEKEIILPENLPPEFGNSNHERRIDDFLGGFSIKKAQKIMEKKLISRALQVTGNNKTKAANLLEISYPSLLNKIKDYGVSSN
ncbi:MAG: sigma-54-dependent Fis family transcriptional regulator, partial [Desulfobulbaceae bacterium]|nr:sigma-54-dependent Fis family transcriptional regulator [Desulfobulbaceae bacterium]